MGAPVAFNKWPSHQTGKVQLKVAWYEVKWRITTLNFLCMMEGLEFDQSFQITIFFGSCG